ncbi:hypothetical protein BB561_002741 [Smittium simulii]|uniref:2,5-diamino-6-ribosylamino-4(3H)-pyrimidinone 5'-phosphate reductase n=1 Tax=Smittium simulii TaxID=133385 RepID=A0A2T9YPA4_9FUNG|nr:hypothetical protein BB561_002741 [Smittium simulii]
MEYENPYSNAKQFWSAVKTKFELDTQRTAPVKPFVTLTFAQSLDAKISSANKQQILLSCKESMVLTHHLRTVHDAILVGVGTVLTDDPRLNGKRIVTYFLLADIVGRYMIRFVEPSEYETAHNPTPVILDTNLRIPENARIIHYHKQDSRCKPPIIVCSPTAYNSSSSKKSTLESYGAKVITVDEADCDVSGRPTIGAILVALGGQGVRSIMVEGGSQIIGSFLKEQATSTNSTIDLMIVTVSPKIIGSLGTGPTDSIVLDGSPPAIELKDQMYKQFGCDFVVASLL